MNEMIHLSLTVVRQDKEVYSEKN